MFFQEILEGPPDLIFGLSDAFKGDPRPQKVNLVMGIYKNEDLKSELLPSVQKAKEAILSEDQLANYLPIDGAQSLVDGIGALLFGDSFWEANQSRIYGAQSVGGTSALRIGAEFTREFIGRSIYVPQPAWPNHRQIFERAGCRVESLPYYDPVKRGFSFSSMLSALQKLPRNSVVLLQGACHNPTGCDPSAAEWVEIAKTMKERQLLPFFDTAYQGFGEGIEEDASAIRHFAKEGLEFLVAYSCSKNFSLYCQRVGVLFAVTSDASAKHKTGSQIKRIIRALYSNPPAHGARIVTKILTGPLRLEWQANLDAMRLRIQTVRQDLVERLSSRSSKGTNFDYLLAHKGMFSYVDMEKAQAQKLIDEFAIYLPDSGRINVAGLNSGNIDYVVDSLIKVLE
jgi:aspartate/tyrosine/aromatic aminotransferase